MIALLAVIAFFGICILLGLLAAKVEIAAEKREEERKEAKRRA